MRVTAYCVDGTVDHFSNIDVVYFGSTVRPSNQNLDDQSMLVDYPRALALNPNHYKAFIAIDG